MPKREVIKVDSLKNKDLLEKFREAFKKQKKWEDYTDEEKQNYYENYIEGEEPENEEEYLRWRQDTYGDVLQMKVNPLHQEKFNGILRKIGVL